MGDFKLQLLVILLRVLPAIASPFIGFYGSAGWGLDYTSELSNQTNIVWVRENDDTASQALQTIRLLQEIQPVFCMKAVIDISPLFFSSSTFLLLPDFAARWAEYLARLQTETPAFRDKIGAFYALDEAYANGLSKNISVHAMQAQLETLCSVVKGSFPNTPIVLSYTPSTFLLPIPVGVDWVGVDCYGNWTSCYGRSMDNYFDTLAATLGPAQRLVLFPDANLQPYTPTPSTAAQQALAVRAAHYFAWAQTHAALTAGLFSFIWQTVPGPGGWNGARDMPLVRQALYTLAGHLANGDPIVPARFARAH